MSMIGPLAQALGAQITRTEAGASLTFERDGAWLTMRVRESPHLEMRMDAPGLALHLWLQLGVDTVRGVEPPALDRLWRVRTDDPALTAALLDEAPWPRAPVSVDVRGALRGIVTIALANINPFLALAVPGATGTSPTFRYVLEIERGVATIERRSAGFDVAASIGMAQRLVQLATWPARTLARAHDTAAALGGAVDGVTPTTMALLLARDTVAVRVDFPRTRRRFRTRVTARSDREVTHYLERLELTPAVLAPLIDRAVAEAHTPRATGPYR